MPHHPRYQVGGAPAHGQVTETLVGANIGSQCNVSSTCRQQAAKLSPADRLENMRCRLGYHPTCGTMTLMPVAMPPVVGSSEGTLTAWSADAAALHWHG